jgi:hypothetical protein
VEIWLLTPIIRCVAVVVEFVMAFPFLSRIV